MTVICANFISRYYADTFKKSSLMTSINFQYVDFVLPNNATRIYIFDVFSGVCSFVLVKLKDMKGQR